MADEAKRTRTVRVATYNIHRGTRPRRPHAARTHRGRARAAIDADIVALQEVVGASPLKPGQAAELGAALGMGWVMAPTRHFRTALFGNVVLSRFPVRHHVQHDLTWKTCEHRGVQRVDLALDDDTLHFYNVHLGTSLLERRHQAREARVARSRSAGDGTEDRAGRFQRVGARDREGRSRRAAAEHRSQQAPERGGRSYPGFFPILHLDHIYYEGKVEVLKVSMPRDRMALMASDHLPLVADLKIGFD